MTKKSKELKSEDQLPFCVLFKVPGNVLTLKLTHVLEFWRRKGISSCGEFLIGSYGLVKLLLVINNLTYTAATAALCRNALFLWLILLFFMTWKTPGLILVMTSSPLPFLQLDHDADYFTTSCYMLQRAGEPLLLTGEKPYRSKIRWLASSSPNLAKGSVSSAISNVFYYLATPLLLRCRFKTRFCPVSKQQLLLLFCF